MTSVANAFFNMIQSEHTQQLKEVINSEGKPLEK